MRKKWYMTTASFGLPVFVLLLVYVVWRQYPFGNNSLLIWDMDWQYSSFFVHLRDILHGDASPFYTLSRAVGGDMAGVAAYYLMSPFNLIFFFFNEKNIYAGILIVTLLKVGTSGLTMYLYLDRKKQNAAALAFSTAYALSAFAVGYQFNILWTDALILLPLVVLGIERLVDEGRYLLYTVSLALSIITNFYTGYMMCIFSVIYFICWFFLLSDCGKKCYTLFLYAASSVLGGLLSMWIALPALYSMQDGKTDFKISVLKNTSKLFGYKHLFEQSFLGTISGEQMTVGLPLIYCGVPTAMLAVYWLLAGRDKVHKKAAYLLMLLFLIVSLNTYNLCSAWQVFNMPNGSPYRFSFFYIFLLICIGFKGYVSITDENRTGVRLVFPAIAFVLIAGLIIRRVYFLELERPGVLKWNVAVILLSAALLLFCRHKRFGPAFLLGLMCMELFLNAAYLFCEPNYYESTKVSDYKEYVESVGGLVNKVKEKEGLFRTVMTGDAYRTVNDSFLFNLYGLDSYTSVEKQGTQAAAFRLGYYHNMVFGIHYKNGSAKAAESLLGVKYMISSEDPGTGYVLEAEDGELGLYRNKYALPVAFPVENELSGGDETYQIFTYLNDFYRSFLSGEGDIFEEITPRAAKAYHCVENEEGALQSQEGEEEAFVDYEIPLQKQRDVYVQYLGSDCSGALAFVNGNAVNLGEQGSVAKRVGNVGPGDKLTLRFYIGEGQAFDLTHVYVYGENEDVLASYAAKLGQGVSEVTADSDSRIKIRLKADNGVSGGLLLTIPFDKGWKARSGGRTLQIKEAQDLMLVLTEPGVQEVELLFIPQGLYAGAAASAAGLLILLLPVLRKKIKVGKNGYGKEKNTI